MRWLRAFLSRLRNLFTRKASERELAAEMDGHLRLHVEDNLREGMTADEARRIAQMRMGGVAQTKESLRKRKGLPMLESVWQDMRFGARMLRKSPGFTAVAILTLALGIGANTAIFSVVNAVLLRPLVFPQSDRLVMVWATQNSGGRTRDNDVASFPDFQDWKAQSKSFESMAAFTTRGATLSSGDVAERIISDQVSPEFFATLGVQPAMGRPFTVEEQEAGASHVVLLGDAFWKQKFQGRPDVIGQTVRINEQPYTIIGVMRAGFEFPPGRAAQILTPLVRDPDRGHGFLRIIGRLRAGISRAAAQSEMSLITQRLEQANPKTNKGVGANIQSLVDALVGDVRTGLWIFLGVVSLVLLIACTNVANLMLARSASRQKEMAVRAALGAGRGRLLQQLLTESAVLALAGGAAGLLIAYAAAPLLVRLVSSQFTVPRLASTRVDGWVLGFTLLLSLAAGVFFGALPAWGAAALDVNENLRETSRASSGSLRGRRVRSALVITETATALVLLAGAGALLSSLLKMQRTAPGFQPEKLLIVDLSMPRSKVADALVASPERVRFFASMLDRVRRLRGVASAALVSDLPLNGGEDSVGFHLPGRPDPPGGGFSANFNIASAGYFHTMGIPVQNGREFSDSDVGNATPVIVINETAAKEFWPGRNPVGQQLLLPSATQPNVNFPLTVIGVTGDVRQSNLGSAPAPEIFLNYQQPSPPWPWLVLVARTESDPASVSATLKYTLQSVDRDMPVIAMHTMEEVLAGSLAGPSLFATLLGVFAFLALALAAVGLYGVVSYTAAQRTHEMGIRMALGAERGDVLRLVLRHGLTLAVIGVAIGTICALGANRTLVHLVPSVNPSDPLTIAGVCGVLLGVALLASYVPARRATKVDPVIALRYE